MSALDPQKTVRQLMLEESDFTCYYLLKEFSEMVLKKHGDSAMKLFIDRAMDTQISELGKLTLEWIDSAPSGNTST